MSIVDHRPLQEFANKNVCERIRGAKIHCIDSKFESLDYEMIENELLVKSEETKGYKYLIKKNAMKWLMFMLIGLITAVVASTVDITISYLSEQKYDYLLRYMAMYEKRQTLLVLFLWIVLNIVPFLIGLLLVTYIEPIAAGSGIPLVKCYLNGIRVPRVAQFKTLVVKAVGLCFSIIGGVASGKEGPMIHIGACVANLIAMGNCNCFGNKWTTFRYFRDDTEMRDLISAGAASGVSAAFGASVGGVLFSLEEGASFWNQSLTWRIFFGSVISKFTVNLILSAYAGKPGQLEHPSLVNLGKCDYKYEILEIPCFMMMGVFGGLMGALWNQINYNFAILRLSILRQKWMRIVEGMLVSGFHAVVAFVMTLHVHCCVDSDLITSAFKTSVGCNNPKQSNTLAALWLQTPQASVNALVHESDKAFSIPSLLTIAISYFLLSNITFGLSTSNGIFVPSMLTGAAWGRLICITAQYLLPTFACLIPGKYALIGAAAQLGGVVRMTISLTVIIMETSDNITFSLPIILTLICAKMTGDFFNDGIYNIIIKLKAAPFLPYDPPALTHGTSMDEIMNRPAVSVNIIESAKYIGSIINNTTHNGFPVLDNKLDMSDLPRAGKIKGTILRSQLIVVLKNGMFEETKSEWENNLQSLETFADWYVNLQHWVKQEIVLNRLQMDYTVNLQPYMNHSPYTLLHTASLPRAFRLFRAIGLRHLPIVDEGNEVVGMITRKDLAQFETSNHLGRINLNILSMK